ncbi:NUDIX domain-containing protein [Taibaiella koreensis]|uniref:NUDIX domain-containing protein n=1 Tax=Taibaiella koreensis TaxID=1268548 RepID=UPI000E599762|nr:NUDIX domain-containing protein [Taibaiella koreensis]
MEHHQAIILDTDILSDQKYTLKQVRFRADGREQQREVYVRPNSATVLPYDPARQTVLLIRQFRLPTFLNGNGDGYLTECCAGVLEEGETPEACIRREAIEELGYCLEQLEKVMESYMSPASVTELVHYFIAPYDTSMKVSEGGGLAAENEFIEVLELSMAEALDGVAQGTIRDAKTILLLQHLSIKHPLS